jgi:biopolymer transport protein ExbD
MNPMVDLAFLLLTFFMMATTFSRPQAMELIMPADTEDEEVEQALPESKVITLYIKNIDSTYIYTGITNAKAERFTFSAEKLNTLLQPYQANQEIMILIKPEVQAPYRVIVDILDELNQMSLNRYVLMDPEAHDQKIIESHGQ